MYVYIKPKSAMTFKFKEAVDGKANEKWLLDSPNMGEKIWTGRQGYSFFFCLTNLENVILISPKVIQIYNCQVVSHLQTQCVCGPICDIFPSIQLCSFENKASGDDVSQWFIFNIVFTGQVRGNHQLFFFGPKSI